MTLPVRGEEKNMLSFVVFSHLLVLEDTEDIINSVRKRSQFQDRPSVHLNDR